MFTGALDTKVFASVCARAALCLLFLLCLVQFKELSNVRCLARGDLLLQPTNHFSHTHPQTVCLEVYGTQQHI